MNKFLYKQVEENSMAVRNSANKSTPLIYGETTGTNSAYQTTITDAPVLSDGLTVLLKSHIVNDYGATFKYNDSPAYPIYFGGQPAEPNMIKKNNYVILRYISSTHIWDIVNSGSGGGAGGGASYYAETTGTTDYLVDLPTGPMPYNGLNLILKVHKDSIVSQKLNYNNFGAKPIMIKNSTLESRKIKAGSTIIVVYHNETWDVVLGGNELYSIGDLGLTDITYLLGDAKYYIRKDITDGQTNISFIGGDIEAFDPDKEELRFLVNGVEMIRGEDYMINPNMLSIDLVGGKVGVSTSVYVFITKLTIMAVTTKNVVVSVNLLKDNWTEDAVNNRYIYEFAVSNLKATDNCVFSIAASSTDSEAFQFSAKKVRCIDVQENKLLISAKAIPVCDIPCALLIVR